MANKPPRAGQFKKGQSGNPKGRPKVGNLREIVQEALDKKGKDGIRSIDKIIAKLKERAEKGDMAASRELFDRAFGKAQQSMQVSTPEGGGGISVEVSTPKEQKEVVGMLNKLKDNE